MRLSFTVSVLLAAILSSCLQIGINLRHKTPRSAAALPEFSERDSLLGSNNPHRAAYDAKHYRIELSFDVNGRTIAGSVTTRLVRRTSETVIQFDLEHSLVVDSIVSAGKRLNFSRRHTALLVEIGSSGEQHSVTVYYHGKPRKAKRPPWEGGFVWKKDGDRNTFAGVACETEGAGLWLPVKAWIGDEADSVTCIFTVPSGLTAVSNGRLLGVNEKNGYRSFHWQTTYPLNPYNITFYLGKFARFSETFASRSGQPVGLDYFVLRGNEEKARDHFKQVPLILSAFEEVFGDYPWQRDGYKLVESPYSGMEHQTAIAYGRRFRNDLPGPSDYIILHESAHEWWGNAVSVTDFADVWIHEGFATYAEALYMEQVGGYGMYLSYMNYLAMRVANRKPLVGPRHVNYWDYKDPDVYVKGAAVLHTIRNQVNNDTLFYGLLKRFFEIHRYGFANTADFESLVAEVAGNDALKVLRHYLYRRASPLLEWWNVEEGGQRGIGFRLKRTEPGVDLRLSCRYGDRIFDVLAGSDDRRIMFPADPGSEFEVNLRRSYLQQKKRRKP